MAGRAINIEAFWDNEANVWVATSEDALGLTLEAETVEALVEKLRLAVPEMIELNDPDYGHMDIPVLLFARQQFIASSA